MDRQKEIELVRQRNAELNQQLDDLKAEMAYNELFETKGYESAKELITEVEKLKESWEAALDDLKQRQQECDELYNSLKAASSELEDLKKVWRELMSGKPGLSKRTMKRIRKEVREMSDPDKSEPEERESHESI